MGKCITLFKNGEEASTLGVGIYDSSKIKDFEKAEVPEQIGLVLYGNPDDSNAFELYENESYIIDAKIDKFVKLLVLDLSNVDLSLLKLRKNELSDEELLSVVGGADDDEVPFGPVGSCKANACGAEICAVAT